MKFQENAKPIYQQIADRICDEVTSGNLQPESRIPSIREYAAVFKVNSNTVMRTFDYLASQGIIYNKRGIGYFISADATALIGDMRERTFFDEELPYFFERLKNIGVSPENLTQLYSDFLENN